MDEHFFQCPYCWKEISMLLDSSVNQQQYIEDCEVCCNPIELKVEYEDCVLINFSTETIDR